MNLPPSTDALTHGASKCTLPCTLFSSLRALASAYGDPALCATILNFSNPNWSATSSTTFAHSSIPLRSDGTSVVLPRPHRSIHNKRRLRVSAISSYRPTMYRTQPRPRKRKTGCPTGDPTSAKETVTPELIGLRSVINRVRRGERRYCAISRVGLDGCEGCMGEG